MSRKRITICLVAVVLACGMALAGCGQNGAPQMNEEQRANRAYMSQVNETMVELDGRLDLFVDAVSRGDIVNMRTQANEAYKVLDTLSDIEAPEKLADIHKSYTDGVAKLREALDGYIDLYSAAAKAGADYDWASYDKRIAEIQALYDEGLKDLQEGDRKAAEA